MRFLTTLSCCLIISMSSGFAQQSGTGAEGRFPGKHYSNGEEIPGVGRAMGDVYILPNGGAYGIAKDSGIRLRGGSFMYFGDLGDPKNAILVTPAGSPATR
jgi:hypothetical protein